MNKNLIWFRNDLRIYDNTALYNACLSNTDEVIGLFIFTTKKYENNYISTKKISFIYQNVISLQKKLLKLNINLYHYSCFNFLDSIEYLSYFCQIHEINYIFYNYQYEKDEKKRDNLMIHKLSIQGITVKGFHDNTLIHPKKIKNKNNQSYKKFYFFKKKIIDCLMKKIPRCLPIPKKRIISNNNKFPVYLIKKLHVNFNQILFPIGEKKAINQLKYFCTYKFEDYFLKRNFPSLNNTSMLSPYLSLGIISIRNCLQTIFKKHEEKSSSTILNSAWINEIIWREYYYHLLINFPILGESKSLLKWEKKINWENNLNYFNAWKNGQTGFPIIDAAMKQLNKIGWMHNRLRMITSSFLIKNLLIDWRYGERYFMHRLIDGDYALNNGGWQWSASIGSDSSPYIRILNPLLQSKNFDKLGVFIKKYLPELKIIPNNYIHEPYQWIIKNNYKVNYPKPIINYKNSKEKFLLAYKSAQLLFK